MTRQDTDMLVFQTSAESRYNEISKELLGEIESAMNACTKSDRISIAAKLCEIPQPEDDLKGEDPRNPMQQLVETLIDALATWASVREFAEKVERRGNDD